MTTLSAHPRRFARPSIHIPLIVVPAILAIFMLATPAALASDPIDDALGSAAATATNTAINTADSATNTATNTARDAGDAVNGAARSNTDAVGGNVVSTGRVGSGVTGSGSTSPDGTPLAAARELHMPQMCLYTPSSMLSQLAAISLATIPGDAASSSGNDRGGASLIGIPFGLGLMPGPTVRVPGLGDVPVGSIVVFLLTMVLGIVGVKTWVNGSRPRPAFLTMRSRSSRPADAGRERQAS
jgi:hypothetical protein